MSLIQLIALGLYGALVIGIIKSLDLSRLWQYNPHQHLVFGASACVFILWLFRTGIYPGLQVHFLWLTSLTLVLGFRWAMLSGLLALFGVTLAGKESWAMFGVNGLLGVSAPIALSYMVYSFSFHRLPKHLFIYIFVCAFFPGAIAIAAKMGLLGGYYWLEGVHNWDVIADNYLLIIPLLLFPEAMLNGMTLTLMVIYKPQWAYTFYDKFYIDGK